MGSIVAFCIVVLTANVLGLASEESIKSGQYVPPCLKEVDSIEEKHSPSNQNNDSEPSYKIKCLAKCVLENYGIFKDSALHEDEAVKVASKLFDDEKAKEIVTLCKAGDSNDSCENAYKLYQCYLENKILL